MERKAWLQSLFVTVGDDLADYPKLASLLERQFQAALAHDAAALSACAAEISELCDALEDRRRERLRVVERLCPPGAPLAVEAALAGLPEALRERGLTHWSRLRQWIADCRDLNLRNGELLQRRREALSRVLEGERDVYVPQ
ncbi:flagellar export chaperone FlgN [Chromobacterium sp. IIBBL 290-4]|uniref:flagellar export chaperone FlgN n=1 Tax=Chromobacterium sp. IIBBL 290-4 TaxID=2953890 RepID=UPI0020B85ADD|nr:flagellar export chaperone FlgN [Chromobacterium sp. IIBBL 290-4]UTH73160.1 flagellar export chaperone FlgN [Chromobacterium sp. IIBBL 290-4]